MKYILVACLLLLFLISCKSNYTKIGGKNSNYIPYYLKVYEADSLFIVGNYQRSYKILDSLFIKYEPIEMSGYYEYSNYVFSSILTNNKKSIKKNAKKAYTDNGGLHSQQIKIVTKLDSIESVIGFSEKERIAFKATYDSKINKYLRELVDKTLSDDQSVRGENYKSSVELEIMDKSNEPVIKQIFKKYDYPSTKKIGFGNSLRAVFIHADNNFKENYLLSKLFDYIKKGEDVPQTYTDTYDKLFMYRNGNFYYSDITSILKGKKLDSVRKSIGLPHKNYIKWRNKMIYDGY